MPRPFVYISAEDIFRPVIPARYIETKWEAERGIEAMMADAANYRGVYIRPSACFTISSSSYPCVLIMIFFVFYSGFDLNYPCDSAAHSHFISFPCANVPDMRLVIRRANPTMNSPSRSVILQVWFITPISVLLRHRQPFCSTSPQHFMPEYLELFQRHQAYSDHSVLYFLVMRGRMTWQEVAEQRRRQERG